MENAGVSTRCPASDRDVVKGEVRNKIGMGIVKVSETEKLLTLV